MNQSHWSLTVLTVIAVMYQVQPATLTTPIWSCILYVGESIHYLHIIWDRHSERYPVL